MSYLPATKAVEKRWAQFERNLELVNRRTKAVILRTQLLDQTINLCAAGSGGVCLRPWGNPDRRGIIIDHVEQLVEGVAKFNRIVGLVNAGAAGVRLSGDDLDITMHAGTQGVDPWNTDDDLPDELGVVPVIIVGVKLVVVAIGIISAALVTLKLLEDTEQEIIETQEEARADMCEEPGSPECLAYLDFMKQGAQQRTRGMLDKLGGGLAVAAGSGLAIAAVALGVWYFMSRKK